MELWLFMSVVAVLIFVSLVVHAFAERRRFSFPAVMLVLAALFAYAVRRTLDTSLLSGGVVDTMLWAVVVILVLDVSSRIHHRMWNDLARDALRFVLVEAALVTLVVGGVWYAVFFGQPFAWPALLLCALFSWLIVPAAHSHVSFSDDSPKSRAALNGGVREMSGILGEMVMVVLVFLLMPLFLFLASDAPRAYTVHPIVGWLVFGIGTGLLLALVLMRLLKMEFSVHIHSLLLIIAAWVGYSIASYLGGNGILAVVSFGLCIGFFSLKKREEIVEHHSNLRVIIEILGFFFAAWVVALPSSITVYAVAVVSFVLYVLVRALALRMTLSHFVKPKELWLHAAYAPKGVVSAAALAVMALIVQRIPGFVSFPYQSQVVLLSQVVLVFLFVSYVVAWAIAARVHSA